MNKKQQGIALLVVGAGLIIWGLDMAGTFGGKLSSAFTGSPGDTAMILYIVGAICVAAGIYRIK
jgi:hypothetical protein